MGLFRLLSKRVCHSVCYWKRNGHIKKEGKCYTIDPNFNIIFQGTREGTECIDKKIPETDDHYKYVWNTYGVLCLYYAIYDWIEYTFVRMNLHKIYKWYSMIER